MPFDEQLKRSFDTLTDRLRDEIDRQVRAAMDELTASARADADAAATAAAAAAEVAAAEVAAAEAAATIASVPAPVETPPPVDGAATERLVEAIRAHRRGRTRGHRCRRLARSRRAVAPLAIGRRRRAADRRAARRSGRAR
jgi:hypothetical protein